MNIEEIRSKAKGADGIAEAIGAPFGEWGQRCHEISLKILRTGWFGEGRIARGTCEGVGGQHSWITLGPDCYSKKAIIVDPTLWSYRDDVDGIYVDWLGASEYGHRPHGSGEIWAYGKPDDPTGEIIELTPSVPLSLEARTFLSACTGPLDRQGWSQLIHSPVGGWPASEILAAIDDTPELSALIPVDILGMNTDRNPGELYR